MRDRNKVPSHWQRIGEGRHMAAVRCDGVEVLHDYRYSGSPYVIQNLRGQVYCQMTGRGVQRPRPRLFKYLDAATAAADRLWPLTIDHQPAFQLVANKDDWRAPIDAIVPADKLVAVLKAIAHFTATEATVSVEGNGFFRVKSVGYRMGPAGP